ncbi:MAG: winged helix-turn-helix transcriptional regulator [Syntrophothermus sp.]
MRSYGQYCSVAKALDVLGDRWTLLIVRELLLRDGLRYTDLRQALPGIATNLLADRLRELEAAGVLTREEAEPPVATTLFHLTSRGEELRPVVEALGNWGLPLMAEGPAEGDVFRSHWLAFPAHVFLSDRAPAEPPLALEVRTGEEVGTIEARDGEISTRLGGCADADLVLSGPPHPILGLLAGALDLPAATAAGVAVEGDPGVLERLRPEGAPAANLSA